MKNNLKKIIAKRCANPQSCILDRDGVINFDSPDFIKNPDEWIPIPGALAAIAKLNHAGYKVFLTSNQSGIGRRIFTEKDLEAIHAKMLKLLEEHGGHFDGIYYCPHSPEDNCDCRKPKTGMIQRLAKEHNINPTDTIHIGDALRDIQVAQAVGAKAILVLTGKGKKTLQDNPALKNQIKIFPNLAKAIDDIICST